MGTANRSIQCGGNSATPHIRKKAMMKFLYCSANRGSSSPTADCMTVRPSSDKIPSKKSKGQSKARMAVRTACQIFLIARYADQKASNQKACAQSERQ